MHTSTMLVSGGGFHRTPQPTKHDWKDIFVQAGARGVVIGNETHESYVTAFVEAFPKGTFIRGEGATLEEAEDKAWEKYQRGLQCPGHEFEPRGYTNGAGFCKHCNYFQSQTFTAEQLGLYCNICKKPSNDTFITTYCQDGTKKRHWYCEEDDPLREIKSQMYALMDSSDEEDYKTYKELSRLVYGRNAFSSISELDALLDTVENPEASDSTS